MKRNKIDPSSARFQLHRIYRRLKLERMLLGARLKFLFPTLDKVHSFPPGHLHLWAPLSTPPGNEDLLPWSSAEMSLRWDHPSCARMFNDALRHSIEVLSSAPVDISKENSKHSPGFLESTRELPIRVIEAYKPIDWHKDFHSGYVWDASEFYFDARVSPEPGVDIKTPWELSKFVHIGILARGDLEQGGNEFILQVLDWIDSNPKSTGVNWSSALVVAIRAINWIWGLRLFEPHLKKYPSILRIIIQSLHEHGRHIERNLDYYVDRTDDHYVGDIVGLIYIAAAFPEFPESDRWLLFGLQEMVSEMERQTFDDGYHQMMSSSYHRFVAELFASGAAIAERIPSERRERLTRVNPREHRVLPKIRPQTELPFNFSSTGSILPEDFFSRLSKMVHITLAMTKPNGLVPQFGDNDSARAHKLFPKPNYDGRDHRHLAAVLGSIQSRSDLIEKGSSFEIEGRLIGSGLLGQNAASQTSFARVSERAILFPDSQISIVRLGNAFLAISCGPNGMQGFGGHGHNDRLSFELNVNGYDLVVDGGCLVYTSNPAMRNQYRSTSAHSTISVVDQEQDPWPPGIAGLFVLKERIRPRLWKDENQVVIGEHYGFGIPHRRRFILKDDSLVIDDELNLDSPRNLNFNLDPSMQCKSIHQKSEVASCQFRHSSGMTITIEIQGCRHTSIQDGCFGLGYGMPVPNKKLVSEISAYQVRSTIKWTLT